MKKRGVLPFVVRKPFLSGLLNRVKEQLQALPLLKRFKLQKPQSASSQVSPFNIVKNQLKQNNMAKNQIIIGEKFFSLQGTSFVEVGVQKPLTLKLEKELTLKAGNDTICEVLFSAAKAKGLKPIKAVHNFSDVYKLEFVETGEAIEEEEE